MHDDAVRRAEAAAVHGVVCRRTAERCGVSERQVSRLVARGRWRRLHRGVFWTERAEQAPVLTVLTAACLAAGDDVRGVITGPSAARLWGLGTDRVPWTPEITLPRSARRSQPPGLRYRWRTLAATEVVLRHGLPVTTVARTLRDCARVLAPDATLVLADAAVRRGYADAAGLAALAATLPPSARWALQRADGRAESAFESRVRAELLTAGLPPPALQHVVHDSHDRFVARVDLAWPAQRLAVEADGAETHSGASALRRDLRRQNLLVAAGWTPLRFTWADLGTIAPAIAAAVTEWRHGAA